MLLYNSIIANVYDIINKEPYAKTNTILQLKREEIYLKPESMQEKEMIITGSNGTPCYLENNHKNTLGAHDIQKVP